MHRAIKVKIVKESKEKLTILMLATNRAMPVKRVEFEERLAEGLYELVGAPSEKGESAEDENE